MARTDGNISAAAERLGIHRSRIYRILAQDENSGLKDAEGTEE